MTARRQEALGVVAPHCDGLRDRREPGWNDQFRDEHGATGSIVSIWMTGGGASQCSPDNMINTSLDPNPWPISVLTGTPGGMVQVNFQSPPTPISDNQLFRPGHRLSSQTLCSLCPPL